MEIIEITVIETTELIEIAVFDPASNIAALDARVTVVENEKLSAVAVDDVTIEGDGTQANPLQAISEELTGADVIDALGYTPANELIEFKAINSATDVTITVPAATIAVGAITTFEQLGAGVIIFAVGTGQNINIENKSSDLSKVVQLLRKPDISGVEQYIVIGGVE